MSKRKKKERGGGRVAGRGEREEGTSTLKGWGFAFRLVTPGSYRWVSLGAS